MQTAVDEFEHELAPLVQAQMLASGTPRSTRATRTSSSSSTASQARRRRALRRERYAALAEAERTGDADGELARRVRLARLASEAGQRDRALADRIIESEARLGSLFSRHRGQIGGREVNDNEIAKILRESTDRDERRAGLGRVEVDRPAGGAAACASSRTCATRPRARSATATTSRSRSTLEELDEDWLLSAARRARGVARGDLGSARRRRSTTASARASASPAGEPLQPWDYADAFFQDAPDGERRPARGRARARSTRCEVARGYFGALGDDVDGVLERSDLYPRDGKNQHAFCTDIDRRRRRARARELRAGRALARRRWCTSSGTRSTTSRSSATLPWLLRQPAHIFTTEAIAMLHGRLVRDETFLSASRASRRRSRATPRNADDAAPRAARLRALGAGHDALRARALRAIPTQDLGALWWQLVERYQRVAPPDGAAARRLGVQDPRRAGAGLLPQLPARRDHGLPARVGARARDRLAEPGRRAGRRRARSCASASCAPARRCAGTR